LFFDTSFDHPLQMEENSLYYLPLEMTRMAPSASNKQPWRVVKENDAWHFFLKRTPGYRTSLAANLLTLSDLQRVDMGIAMCHFELAALEAGICGTWQIRPADTPVPSELTEYTATWQTTS
jgi:hypothetical protein